MLLNCLERGEEEEEGGRRGSEGGCHPEAKWTDKPTSWNSSIVNVHLL